MKLSRYQSLLILLLFFMGVSWAQPARRGEDGCRPRGVCLTLGPARP